MERLGVALRQCDGLKALSFSKNNLGIHDYEDTESEFNSEVSGKESLVSLRSNGRQRNRKLCNESNRCMTNVVIDMTERQTQVERLCLAHC
jgi:hypothetical protein